MSHLLNRLWLSRYPRPEKIIFDNGSEFKKDFRFIFDDYGLKKRPTTIKNPQANSILERVHQVLGNMLRTKNLANLDFNVVDTWPNILASVAFAIRSTHHSTLGASPAQLVFGRDMVLPLQFVAEWEYIRTRKQEAIDKSNLRENKKCVDWDYKIGDFVLISDSNEIKRKLDCPTRGPYKIIEVYSNGTVRIENGATTERINIRRCTPYHA